MKRAKKNNNSTQRYTPLLVVAAFALVGVGALQASHAKRAEVSGNSVSKASVSGVSACSSGIWVVTVSAISNVAVLAPVDVLRTTSKPSGFSVIASNVYLHGKTPYSFDYSPQAGARTDSLYIVPHGATPTNEATLATASIVNPCM